MAAGLTDHVWTLEEMLRYRVLPVTRAPAPRQTDEVGRARATRAGKGTGHTTRHGRRRLTTVEWGGT